MYHIFPNGRAIISFNHGLPWCVKYMALGPPVATKPSGFAVGFCGDRRPSGHVFHTSRQAMIKTYNLVYHDTPKIWWTHIWLWPALSVMSNSTSDHFVVFNNIHQPYTPRDATLADQRTCVYRYRQLIFTHCEHNVSQEHLLKPRDYHQLAPPVQFDNQLASSLYSVGFILPGSRSTVGFITRDFHALISQQHSQTNRRGLYTLFLKSKSWCMQKISSVDALLTAQNVLSWSGRIGSGHTGWSQLQLASSVSPLWMLTYHQWGFETFT